MPPKKSATDAAIDVANQKLKKLKKKGKTQDEKDAEDRKKKAKAKEYRDKRFILTQPERDSAKQKIIVPDVSTGYREKAVIANEKAIRESFGRMITLSDEKLSEIREEMENLVYKHAWGSKLEFEKMVDITQVLPPTLYKDLAKAYIEQDKSFNIFWTNYKSRPNILSAMKENKDELDSLPSRKPEPRKLTYREPSRVNKVDTRPPWEKGVKELNHDGDVIEPPKTEVKSKLFFVSKPLLSIPPFEDCFKEKKTSIIENVAKTFITPIGNDKENEHFQSIIKSRGVTESFTESKETWYLVNENLALFLCKTNRIWNDESSSVIAILPDKKKIIFKVGYMTSEKIFFLQNDKHFKRESEYINKLKQTRDGQIGGILGSQISPKIQDFARSFLSESLTRVATDVKQYQNTEEHSYVYESVQKMIESSDGSTKKLFENLANITVFLQNQSSIFAERVRDQYYIPPILVTLTVEEKLPEVFDDPNQNKKFVKSLISRQINTEVKRIAESLYNRNNPT